MADECTAPISASLQRATAEKLSQYRSLLKANQETAPPFWDVVVVTAGDAEQQRSYEQQLQLKLERKEIPGWIRYIVIADPPGHKIGNGGATMHAIEEIKAKVPSKDLESAKVLLVHAGGYSQRLPSVSVLGKAFLALPFGDPMFQMVEAVLMMFIDLPARMAPGIFLSCPDIIFLYNGKGDWDFSHPGITAIGHPASLEIASTHGVYLVDDITGLREKYAKDPSNPTMMSSVRRFLHKLSPDRLKEAGAVIPGSEQTYVDICYYMDFPTAWKLLEFYEEHKPLTCEIDAYGDFLQALGCDATNEYCKNVANVTTATDDLVVMREKVFNAVKGIQFRVCIFHEAQFNHVGTTREYLYHFSSNQTFLKSCQVQEEVMVGEVQSEEEKSCAEAPLSKVAKVRSFEDCIVMHSLLHHKESVSVGAGSIVEFCTVQLGVTIGTNCIVSNLDIPSHIEIPSGSYLHTVAVELDGQVQYATFAFDVYDNMKAKKPREQIADLKYCKLNMSEALVCLGYSFDDVIPLWPPQLATCSLWEARLFPVFPTRRMSSGHAISMMRSLRGLENPLQKGEGGVGGKRVSMADMLRLKSTKVLLDYHTDLRTKILALQSNH